MGMESTAGGTVRCSAPPVGHSLEVIIELEQEDGCFMDVLDGDITDVHVHFSDDICHCDVTVCDTTLEGHSEIVVHNSQVACPSCPGIVFSAYDCAPRFLDRHESTFVIRTYVPDRETLVELVSELRAVCRSVSVVRIVERDGDSPSQKTGDVDLTALTPKQHEALERAVQRGYYDTPRRVSLDDLSAEFSITRPALSQRLAQAERTVLEQLFA